MNTILKSEYAGAMLGVPGRYANVIGEQGAPVIRSQTFITEARHAKSYGATCTIIAKVRFDDECKNGHNTFAITGTIRDSRYRGERGEVAGGCVHDDIAAAFPELAPLLRWHLTSSDGPMHYIANTVYHAGDRDCHGLRKGERRQLVNGKTSDAPPLATPKLEWRPWYRVGEGKARDLDAARNSAVWPDASDSELSVEPEQLRAALVKRHAALVKNFREDMLGAGFIWTDANSLAGADR